MHLTTAIIDIFSSQCPQSNQGDVNAYCLTLDRCGNCTGRLRGSCVAVGATDGGAVGGLHLQWLHHHFPRTARQVSCASSFTSHCRVWLKGIWIDKWLSVKSHSWSVGRVEEATTTL